MAIRHTVVITFRDTVTDDIQEEVIKRLNEMGDWLVENVGATDWAVKRHIPETFKEKRAHLLQDCIFPDLDSMSKHADSDAHHRVVEMTRQYCDWMTVDTEV